MQHLPRHAATSTTGGTTGTARLWVPAVTAPTGGTVGQGVAVAVRDCPSRAMVVMHTGDGRTFTAKASTAGTTTLHVKLLAKGTLSLSLSVSVSGATVATTHVTVT